MGALNLVLYLAIRFIDSFETAIIVNTNLGGDNCHRGAVLGCILGTALGIDGLPRRWVMGLEDRERLETDVLACVEGIIEHERRGLPIKGEEEDVDASVLAEELRSIGFEVFLAHLQDAALLKKMAKDLDLKTPQDASNNNLVEAIIDRHNAFIIHRKKEPLSFSRKKMAIRSGRTYQDLFQWYNVVELQDWCEEHNLSKSGKKSVVIKRILASFEEEKENQSTSKSSPRKSKKPVKQVSSDDDDEEDQMESE